MSQKIKCLNEENVRLLCSFINKAFSKDEIIDDINIKSDGVFSSYYTTKLLQQLKTDNENYTNTVFGELTYLTCEETNILPTLDNTEVNTLYLYSATLTAPYQQYLKISDGTTEKLINLGSTSISLSEYMKAIDIANTYTTKIETQAIIDTIGSPSDLETTAKDTLVSAINEIKEGLDNIDIDNCVTKDAIVTTLDSTVTDTQVPSALGTKTYVDDLFNQIDLTTYYTKPEIDNLFATSGGGSSEKQIKDWVSGSSYLEGDYIYHEGELYRCLATNNNVDFNETNWEQITYGIDELSKEDVERLLGLTKEEIEAMADLILDTEVRIDKTYSSSKIYTDIQQCLEDSKTYTLKELGKLNGTSYKVVASTSEMTSESIIYLLPNATNYDMYIVEEDGTATKIGNMDIDLSQYFTKQEITDNYYDKATSDGKFATITTIDNHIVDNTIHITQAEKDSYVKKTEVLSVDNVSHIKRFYSVPGNDWNNAIEEGYYAIAFDSVANTIANRPYDYAIQVHVIKADVNDPIFVYQIAYISTSDTRIYIRKQKIDGSWTLWERICTTSIADVPNTLITSEDTDITLTSNCKYTVVNGVCYVTLWGFQSATTGTHVICTSLPKTKITSQGVFTYGNTGFTGGCAFVYSDADKNGKLYAEIGVVNTALYGSFSYPVAE